MVVSPLRACDGHGGWEADLPPAPVMRMRPAAREGSPLEAGPLMRRPFTSSAQACLDLGVSTGGPAPSRKPKGSDTGLQEHVPFRACQCAGQQTS